MEVEGGMICLSYVLPPLRYLGGSSRGSATGENINPLKYREISVRTRRPIAGRRLRPKADLPPPYSLLSPSTLSFRVCVGGAAVLLPCCSLQRARAGSRSGAGLEGGAVFSRNNNLSLSNKRGRRERERGPALRTLANKCWRNKILLPNNIRGRSLLLLNSAALCSVTIPGKLWPPLPSPFQPCSPGFAHGTPPRIPAPSSILRQFSPSILKQRVVRIRVLYSRSYLLTIYISTNEGLSRISTSPLVDLCLWETNKGRKGIREKKAKFSFLRPFLGEIFAQSVSNYGAIAVTRSLFGGGSEREREMEEGCVVLSTHNRNRYGGWWWKRLPRGDGALRIMLMKYRYYLCTGGSATTAAQLLTVFRSTSLLLRSFSAAEKKPRPRRLIGKGKNAFTRLRVITSTRTVNGERRTFRSRASIADNSFAVGISVDG